MHFSDRGPLSETDQAVWFENAVVSERSDWSLGVLAIEGKRDGRIIGYISLSNDVGRVGTGDAELGVRLAKHAWGRGYATEAVLGMIDAAEGMTRAHRIVAIVDPHNNPSVRVLEKAGMIKKGDLVLAGYDYPDHLYVRELRH